MLQCLEWSDSLFWVPHETLAYKVVERLALVANDLDKWARVWQSQRAISLLEDVQRLISALLKELVTALSILEHFERRHAKDLHYECQLFHLALSWEDWDACIKLYQDTAETPHVDASCVWDANDDLWRSVEARLDVGVDPLV